MQSFIAMGIISMVWVVVGFSLSFGDDVGGIVAMVFTGVFAQTGLIAWTHAGFMEFIAAVAGVAIVIAYTFVVSMILYWITNRLTPMRVSPPCEAQGLDVSQHDEVYCPSLQP